MRIAIIGAGISGLSAAYWLRHAHDVTVLEANDYVGGHTHTVDVRMGAERQAIDTGFIVYNERTYPNFSRLLDELQVATQPSEMSFSVTCQRSGLEYAGTNLNGLFAQRRNLLRPSFHRLLWDWLRFSREAPAAVADLDLTATVGEFFRKYRYSEAFRQTYFLPMGSAIWSCPRDAFEQFPMRFIVEFYQNHGLLSLRDRPLWRVIQGGSRRYVEAIVKKLPRAVRTGAAIKALVRRNDRVDLIHADGAVEGFDHAVVACHSDQALRMLGSQATVAERDVLAAIGYQANSVLLHTDRRALPRLPRAWASWNYRLSSAHDGQASVTYYMNRLQSLKSAHHYCVTLNDPGQIDAAQVLGTFRYEHPIFSSQRGFAQQRHAELIDRQRVSFCGAYWGNGFHEDGVNSALAVCKVLNNPSARNPQSGAASHA